jgi:hypothetical protein
LDKERLGARDRSALQPTVRQLWLKLGRISDPTTLAALSSAISDPLQRQGIVSLRARLVIASTLRALALRKDLGAKAAEIEHTSLRTWRIEQSHDRVPIAEQAA